MTSLDDSLRHSLSMNLSNKELKDKIKESIELERGKKKIGNIEYQKSKEFKITPETFYKLKLCNR